MNKKNSMRKARLLTALAAAAILAAHVQPARAEIQGITGPAFTLTAKSGYISTPDGGSTFTWGYANGAGSMQYPGPTLIVNEGDPVTVALTNQLDVPVSIVFPGQENVTATGGAPGLITREALPGGVSSVTYSFTASRPGTFMYHSGTEQDLQIEMGLVGALIVRPSVGGLDHAYDHAAAQFDVDPVLGPQEYLFLLTEMDLRVHQLVEKGLREWVDTTTFDPVYWFINGRAFPDTAEAPDASWLPHQPYNSLPIMHPGQRVLMRFIGAGRQMHPFHPHGNHVQIIATDAKLLVNGLNEIVGPTLFTQLTVPGQTMDGIFTWTGKDLGWDIYGTVAQNPHNCADGNTDGYDDTTWEWCADHNKPIPVDLPEGLSLAYGGHYSGSPYMGVMGSLPPGEGGMNPNAGFAYMWHSHTEKELLNNDVFPGGMATMLIIDPWE